MKWSEAVLLAFCLLPFHLALRNDDLPITAIDEMMCPRVGFVATSKTRWLTFIMRKNPMPPSMQYISESNAWAYVYSHPFKKGQTLYLRSRAYQLSEYSYEFEINLMAGTPAFQQDKGGTALHVKLTFIPHETGKIIADTCVSGKWLDQVSVDNPLSADEGYEIAIYAADDKFEIRINGVKVIDYPYRLSLDHINYVNAMGSLRLYQMYIGTEFDLPYMGEFMDFAEFANNDVIIFRGVPGEGGFTINVYSARDDIVLQFNVTSLSQQQCIELNSQFNGKWAEPQRIDGCPFAVGKEFKIYIQNNSNRVNYFTTYVDTKLISTYNASTKAVMNARLEVTGDVSPRDLTICVMMSPRDTNTLVLS